MPGAGPDLATVEALCAVQLLARRLGCTLRVCEADERLRELITFAGLGEVLLDPPGEPPGPSGPTGSAGPTGPAGPAGREA